MYFLCCRWISDTTDSVLICHANAAACFISLLLPLFNFAKKKKRNLKCKRWVGFWKCYGAFMQMDRSSLLSTWLLEYMLCHWGKTWPFSSFNILAYGALGTDIQQPSIIMEQSCLTVRFCSSFVSMFAKVIHLLTVIAGWHIVSSHE